MIDKVRIKNAIKEILIAIGEDPNREGLVETPARVADMFSEIFKGIHKNALDEIKLFSVHEEEEMVIVKDIPLYSMCEHHLLPFIGKAHVAYIPSKGKVVGLSKIARIVDVLSKRPQLQERLSSDIADMLVTAVKPMGVAVVIEAEHLCMTMRGIRKPGAKTITSSLRGVFKNDPRTRAEVLNLIIK